jgi:hypothetical protein
VLTDLATLLTTRRRLCLAAVIDPSTSFPGFWAVFERWLVSARRAMELLLYER